MLRAQALLSRASVEVGLESQGNLDLVAFQLAQAIGPAVKFPDLQPQGFKFVRAKLLRFGDRPLAQILYLGAEGAPLAIYAMRGSGDGEPAFRQEGAIGFVSWTDDGIAYLLADREDQARVSRARHCADPCAAIRTATEGFASSRGTWCSRFYPAITGSAPTSQTTPPN